MAGQTTRLRTQCPLPSARVRLGGAVRPSAPMPRYLPAYRRRRAPQADGDAANRLPRSNPARNLFPFIQHQRHQAAPTTDRRDPSIESQDMMDRALGPFQGPGDIARALATLPPLPQFNPLLPR